MRPSSPKVGIGLPVPRVERVDVTRDRGIDALDRRAPSLQYISPRFGPCALMPESNVHRCSPVAARSANVLCDGVTP